MLGAFYSLVWSVLSPLFEREAGKLEREAGKQQIQTYDINVHARNLARF